LLSSSFIVNAYMHAYSKFAATFALHNIVRLAALGELVPEYTPLLAPPARSPSPSHSPFFSQPLLWKGPPSLFSPPPVRWVFLYRTNGSFRLPPLPFHPVPLPRSSPMPRSVFVPRSLSAFRQPRSKLAFLSSPLSPGYLNPQARKAFGDSQRQPLGSRPRFASLRLVRSLAVCTREETPKSRRVVS